MNSGSNKAAMRLKNEFNNLTNETICQSTVLLENEDNLFNWIIVMQGPEATPYEGGIFKLQFKFPDNYPFKAPDVKFITTMYHPNIKMETGEICQDVFASGWAPTQKVQDILEKLVSMLKEPATSSPLENDICNEYINNRAQFNKAAREHTLKYAN
jgi:ubiquitin-conjugating enzyme E2 D/E